MRRCRHFATVAAAAAAAADVAVAVVVADDGVVFVADALGYRSRASLAVTRRLHRTATYRNRTSPTVLFVSVGGLRGSPNEAPNGQATCQVARRNSGMRRRGVQQVSAAAAAAAAVRI